MSIQGCYNFHDFHRLAKRRLPKPIFDLCSENLIRVDDVTESPKLVE